MQDPKATFVEQLQEAVDRGQVVFIPTPAPPIAPPVAPLLRNKDKASLAATLCMMLGLTRTQGYVLLGLTTEGYVTVKEICTIAAQNDQILNASTRSVRVFVYNLRKKLTKHSVKILTIHRFGYGLPKEGREKICRMLAAYNRPQLHGKPPRAALVQEETPMT
jgi:hypothetical protein